MFNDFRDFSFFMNDDFDISCIFVFVYPQYT
jgi:hypothetical protein